MKKKLGKIDYKKIYLKDLVFEKLQRLIYEGELKQGEKLFERDIVESFGVSRTSVRTALERLAAINLIKIIPNRGFEICNWSKEDIRNVSKIRAALERLAIEQAINNLTENDIEDFQKIIKKINIAFSEDDRDECTYYNHKFHWKIISLSNNEYLIEMIKPILDKIRYFGKIYISDRERLKKAFEEHEKIFNAIKNKDVELAQRLVEEHSRIDI